MKPLILPFLTVVLLSLILTTCYYDTEEALYPSLSSACDTVNVTFSGTISSIMANNCLSCHSNTRAATAGNNIRLENYADVQARVVSVVGSINHSGAYSPMPKNGDKIKFCSIAQFDIWVRNGTPDN